MIEQYSGKIIRIFSQRNDWASFLFEDDKNKNRIVACGTISGMIYDDMDIELEGNIVFDPKFGNQIKISKIQSKESPLVVFLYKGIKGIGQSLAKKIVDELGDNCIEIIKENPEKLLLIKGIKEKKLKMIEHSLNETNHIQLHLDIFNYFNNDVTLDQVNKIIQATKGTTKGFDIIKENPYWLIANVDGFGFKRVDKLALAAGIGEFSKDRIKAAATYVLNYVSVKEAHCYLNLDELAMESANLVLQGPEAITNKELEKVQKELLAGSEGIDAYISSHRYAKELMQYMKEFQNFLCLLSDILAEEQTKDKSEREIEIDQTRIYAREIYLTEKKLAWEIVQMNKKNPVKNIPEAKLLKRIKETEESDHISYESTQIDAIKNSMSKRLSLIVGGPGRGKTTITKAIISSWDDDDSIILLAPTGRAAKRMTEATGYMAKTIHRYSRELKSEEDYPKDALIIMDEVSMLGINLASLLFKIARNCNLILIGDANQLPSIEPGNFLGDIIASKRITTTFLTVGFRSDGSIAENSELVNQGKGPSSYIYDTAFQFTTAEKEEIPKSVLNTFKEYLKNYNTCEIGIITPIRSKGYSSVDKINEIIRSNYNPPTKSNPENSSGFRVFDRVMNIKNDYNRETEHADGSVELGVYNGDTGTVSDIDPLAETITVLFDDGKTSCYKFSEKEYLVLAYAITVHKSQGSQYKALIVVVSSEYSFFVKRKMLYTAISRARDIVTMIGSKKAAAQGARNNSENKRNTYLKERIIKYAE